MLDGCRVVMWQPSLYMAVFQNKCKNLEMHSRLKDLTRGLAYFWEISSACKMYGLRFGYLENI